MEKVDSVIIADKTGKEYLKTMKGIKHIDTIDDPQPGASIAFRKNDAALAKEFTVTVEKLKQIFMPNLLKNIFQKI